MTEAKNEYQQMCAELDFLRDENLRLREVIASEHFHHKTPQIDCYRCVDSIMKEKSDED